MDQPRFEQALHSIYEAVDALEAMFPGRHFTPDGHMVGSLGEALAAHHYGLELHAPSEHCHDGICGERQVQVKATQGDRIAISSEPEHLLVLKLNRDGTFTEHYNGPGALVWNLVCKKPRPKNGQYQVLLRGLALLMASVPADLRLTVRNPNHSIQRAPNGAAD